MWSWSNLKALTGVRNWWFNCCFSLQVHSVEGLPRLFDELSLVVHWKRRDGELMTRPVKVVQGMVEFEEQLTHSCSIFGSKSGHSAKYEAKQHSSSTRKGLEQIDLRHELSVIRQPGSMLARSSISYNSMEGIKDLHEALPISELSDSISFLYQKLHEEKKIDVVPVKLEVDAEPEPAKPDVHLTSEAGNETKVSELHEKEVARVLKVKEMNLKFPNIPLQIKGRNSPLMYKKKAKGKLKRRHKRIMRPMFLRCHPQKEPSSILQPKVSKTRSYQVTPI